MAGVDDGPPQTKPKGALFLVIPSFRDALRLGQELPQLARALSACTRPVEIQVVDDGSGATEAEATSSVVEKCRAQFSNIRPLLRLPRNLGKGGAIYAGWAEADSGFDWLGFVDADGATPANEVVRLLDRLAAEEDCWDGMLACRIQMLGRKVNRHEIRHFMGRFYATLANALTGLPVHDSQCGCKFFRRRAYEAIRPYLGEFRFGFDMEMLWHLGHHGARLVEVPIDWTDIPGSKVRVFRDGWLMLTSLYRLRTTIRRLEKREQS